MTPRPKPRMVTRSRRPQGVLSGRPLTINVMKPSPPPSVTHWIENTTIRTLRSAASPGAALTSAGITVHIESLDPAGWLYSLVVTDAQGRWWALGLEDDGAGEVDFPGEEFWDCILLRQYMLDKMLAQPVAGPAQDPTDLLHQMIALLDQEWAHLRVSYVDGFEGAVHLLTLLDSDLTPETQDSLHFALSARDVKDWEGTVRCTLDDYLARVREWQTNRSTSDWAEATRAAMFRAGAQLLPKLFPPLGMITDEDDDVAFLQFPRDDWDAHALDFTREMVDAILRYGESHLAYRYQGLSSVWAELGHPPDGFDDYLRSALDPAR